MKGKISTKEIFGKGFYSFGQSVWTAFLGTYILFFYTDVAHISPITSGIIICAAIIWDIVMSHVSVLWVSSHKFRNGERLRPFLVYSSLLLAVLLVLTFTVFGTGYITIIVAVITVFALRIPAAFSTLSGRAMFLNYPENSKESSALNKLRFVPGAIGSVFVSTILYVIICAISGVDGSGNMLNSKLGFMAGAGIVGVMVIASGLFYYSVSFERNSEFEEDFSNSAGSMRILLSERAFVHNMIITFFNALIKSIIAGLLLYYCKYVICNTNLFIPISAAFVIGVVLSIPLVSWLRRKMSSVGIMVTAALILVIGSIVFILFADSIFAAFILPITVGLGSQMLSGVLSKKRENILEVLEKQKNIKTSIMLKNTGQLSVKLAAAVMVLAFGFIMDKSGFDPNIIGQSSGTVVSIVLTIGVGILFSSAVIGVLSAIQNGEKEPK